MINAVKNYVDIPFVDVLQFQHINIVQYIELAKEMGECLADDCYEREVDVLLGPGVNIKRHPLNGRNFEYLSEDSYLAGTLAKSYVEGLQSRGIVLA